MEEGHITHLPRDDSIPTFCLQCVLATLGNDMVGQGKGGIGDAQYIGMLRIKEALKYTVACHSSAPAETYRRKGFVVIEGDSSINSARDGVTSNVSEYIQDRKLGTLDKLHNRKDSRGTDRRHKGRRWKNIFPGDNVVKDDRWKRDIGRKSLR